jgi:hypothetical protein
MTVVRGGYMFLSGEEVLSWMLEAQVQGEQEVSRVHIFDAVQTLEEGGVGGGDRVVDVAVS